MKKAKSIKEPEPDELPFSFLKQDIDDEKIKAHWKKIKEKIEKQLPEPPDNEQDNKLV